VRSGSPAMRADVALPSGSRRPWRQSILPYPMEPLGASNRTPSASAGPSPEGRRTQDRSLALPVLLEALKLRHRSKHFPGCVVRRRVPCGTPICRTHGSRPPDRDARASAVCATGEDSIGLWELSACSVESPGATNQGNRYGGSGILSRACHPISLWSPDPIHAYLR